MNVELSNIVFGLGPFDNQYGAAKISGAVDRFVT